MKQEDVVRRTKYDLELEILRDIEKAEEFAYQIDLKREMVEFLEDKLLGMERVCLNCSFYNDGKCDKIHTEVKNWGICEKFQKREEDESQTTREEIL